MRDKIKPDCFYIFVNLNGDKMIAPEYCICSSEEAKNLIDEYETRGIITLSKLAAAKFDDTWKNWNY